MRLTVKQIELLTVISKGTQSGTSLDIEQILDGINYETTKESLQFSLRALIKHKLIIKKGMEKRRCYNRVVIEATAFGCQEILEIERETPFPPYVLSVEDDELSSLIR
jgi:repressor of nif and glnA expression